MALPCLWKALVLFATVAFSVARGQGSRHQANREEPSATISLPRQALASLLAKAIWKPSVAFNGGQLQRCRSSSRASPASMLFDNPFKDKMDGATTVRLTIGMNMLERGPRSVIRQLDDLADRADTSCAEGIADLCHDSALALLRRSGEWRSTYGSIEFNGDEEVALSAADRLSVREAAKFDEREFSKSDDKNAGASQAVVSIVATMLGDREEELPKNFAGQVGPMKQALEEIAAISNDVDSVLFFEIFWVPGGDDEVLDATEVIVDWPELLAC